MPIPFDPPAPCAIPTLDPGDLVVFARSNNLVFVPDTGARWEYDLSRCAGACTGACADGADGGGGGRDERCWGECVSAGE